jgi:hypothetical protein
MGSVDCRNGGSAADTVQWSVDLLDDERVAG